MGFRLYNRLKIIPGVSRYGLLMALSVGLAGGCGHKEAPLPRFQFVELVKVTGQCSEDHVRESEQVNIYSGEIDHYYDPTTGRHIRNGSVNDIDGANDEQIAHEVKDPAWYAPPFAITFGDLSADDIAGVSLSLHGISERLPRHNGGETEGFHATCHLKVTERSDHLPTRPKTAR